MDLHHFLIPRKKRHWVLLSLVLLTTLLAGLYIAKSNVVSRSSSLISSTSSLKSHMKLDKYERHHVIHTLDHGCYLQTANFTHHLHSPRLLAERGCEQKLPVALVIGGALCGTLTFRSALSFHPDVVVPEGDTPLFEEKDVKDKEQYLAAMPFSLPNQLTVDESQEYMYTLNCSKEFAEMIGPKLKIIVLLRDPVARAMSEYLLVASRSHSDNHQASLSHRHTCFARKENKTLTPPAEEVERDVSMKTKRHVKKQMRKDKHHMKERQKERTKRKNKRHREKRGADERNSPNSMGSPKYPYKLDEIDYSISSTFEDTVFDENKHVRGANFLLQRSIYVPLIKKWRRGIEDENVLILDAEDFSRNPAATMRVAEKFLGLPPYFEPEFFDFSLPSGRLCFNAPVRSCVEPLLGGQSSPPLADPLVSELREFLIPWIKIQNRLTKLYFPHLGEYPLVSVPFR